jgi:hypothetical protein
MRREEEPVILIDPRVLSETHLPLEIVARDRQIEEIGLCLDPTSRR